MSSSRRGRDTSVPEIINVSTYGFCVLLDEQEVFASFDDFPWFREATIAELTRVERPSADHLYWPDLDIDLHLDSLHHPHRYPLKSRDIRRSAVRESGDKPTDPKAGAST